MLMSARKCCYSSSNISYHLSSTYYVPGIQQNTLHILYYLILIITLQERYYHIYLTDDGNELHRLNQKLMTAQPENGRIGRTHFCLIPMSLFIITFTIVQIFKE